MAFVPSWTATVSSYDPNAPVDLKRAQEIFPNDLIKELLKVLEKASTAKVAKFTIKDLAKKKGGKGGLHDMFIERRPELAKELDSRQFKHAEQLVQELTENCAKFVVESEHKRRVMFGAAIRIGVYVRGYLARKLLAKRKRIQEEKIRNDNAATIIQSLIRRVLSKWHFQDHVARRFLWQSRGRSTRFLERAVVLSASHVRNDSNEQRLSLSILIEGGTRWDPFIIGASVTAETVPSLREPIHPNGSIAAGETAIVFAHYGVTHDGRGRRAPVVICRHDLMPPTRKERFLQEEIIQNLKSSGGTESSTKNKTKKDKKRNGKKRGGRRKRRGKSSENKQSVVGSDSKLASAVLKDAKQQVGAFHIPKVPFDHFTDPISYILMCNGGMVVPESRKAIVGSRKAREEREDFYVLQHMSGFMGRDLVRYLESRGELPALASPDGSGADGKWARDRRRKYWESTTKRHNAILACRRRLVGAKPRANRAASYENRLCKAVDVEVSTLSHPVDTGVGVPWRLIFFDDDGVLNKEDTLLGGRAKPLGPLDMSEVSGGKGEVARRTCYNMTESVWNLDNDMVSRLVGICNETSAKLICCSDGRRNCLELGDQLTEALFNAGLPQNAFLGFTPDLSSRVYEEGGPAPGPSQRIEAVRRWIYAQNPRRHIEAWVIVDKLDLIRGDGRDNLHLKKVKKERLQRAKQRRDEERKGLYIKSEVALRLEQRAEACKSTIENVDMLEHFVRTHLRKGLTEERAGEIRRLLLLPKLKVMKNLESKLVQRKKKFEERSEAFLVGMPTEGPFVPGIKAKESARRLKIFLKVFSELAESIEYLNENYAKLREVVDGDAFLSTDFRWDPGKHRKVKSTYNELKQAHEKHLKKQEAHQQRHAEIVSLKKGGRFCPLCGILVEAKADFLLNPESNNWLHCNQKDCNFFFCQRCGAKRGPIEAHGAHRHVPGCQFYKKKLGGDKKDPPLRFWSAATIEVKRGKKKAGDVRCVECTKMQMETEACEAPMKLPVSWREDKDPDPKLSRIRRHLADLERKKR